MSDFAKLLRAGPPSTEDRHQVLERIIHLLAKGQSINIVGEGGSGKTTLLRQVLHPAFMRQYGIAPEQFLIAGVTGEDILGCSTSSFWMNLILPDLAESARQVNKSTLAEDIAAVIQRAPTDQEAMRRAVDDVFYAIKSARLRVLLGWDDFDWVRENKEFDENFFNFLRALAQEYPVTYLIASEHPLQTCWSQEKSQTGSANVSPFFNIFYSVTLSAP